MSIQQDKYKALRSTNKTTLKNLAKKYGYDIPKNLKSLSSFGKRLSNFIEKLQYQNYESGIPEVKTPTGLYKQYLKKSGLHDTSQSKQNFKDIQEFTKLARQIEKELNTTNLSKYFTPMGLAEIRNKITNKTKVKDFINTMPKELLRNSIIEDVNYLKDKTSSNYLEEIIKRNTTNLTKSQVEKLMKEFNKKSFIAKFRINQKLYTEFYEEYERQGNYFNAYNTLQNIIGGV